MKKFKYFNLIDPKKETVGVVQAENEEKAYNTASKIKQLSLSAFRKLFGIEKL